GGLTLPEGGACLVSLLAGVTGRSRRVRPRAGQRLDGYGNNETPMSHASLSSRDHIPGAVSRRSGLTLTVLAIACVAYVLQQTLVVPAIPNFQRDLHTSATWAAWVFTGFLLTSAVVTTPLGKLGDTYGKRRLLVIALGSF